MEFEAWWKSDKDFYSVSQGEGVGGGVGGGWVATAARKKYSKLHFL